MRFFLLLSITVFSVSVLAEYKISQEEKEYIEKMRKSDIKYEGLATDSLFKDKAFVSECWQKVSPLGVNLYFTIGLNGKPTDIKWFTSDTEISCVAEKIKNHQFPVPTKIEYIQLYVWDGAGG